jgi:hypothetical protein
MVEAANKHLEEKLKLLQQKQLDGKKITELETRRRDESLERVRTFDQPFFFCKFPRRNLNAIWDGRPNQNWATINPPAFSYLPSRFLILF